MLANDMESMGIQVLENMVEFLTMTYGKVERKSDIN